VRRAFVVVLDAVGAGATADAADYGDAGANTLGHLADALGGLDLPVLQRLGLGDVLALRGVPPADPPAAVHGRLHPLGPGKDSTTGHWELFGVVAPEPPPAFTAGFPPEIVAVVERASGRGVLCNRPYDGIGAIEAFGAEHLATGHLVLYTSQDSVLQLAAHVDVLPPADLHAICARVRAELAVPIGRVIARPFAGGPGRFARVETGRRDFALPPPAPSHLDALRSAGVPVHAVGKVHDLFAGHGFDAAHPGATNAAALASTTSLIATLDHGLVVTNLIETDQVYGHRKDLHGFHRALQQVDAHVGAWLADGLRDGDLLVLTADHGVDMTLPGTDHTREHAPLLALAGDGSLGARRHDGPLADVGATVLDWLAGQRAPQLPGASFLALANA